MDTADAVVRKLRRDGFIEAAMNGISVETTTGFQAAEAVAKELATLRAENEALRAKSNAQQVHIERLCRRNRLKCAASGCPGCVVCDPIAALAAKGE